MSQISRDTISTWLELCDTTQLIDINEERYVNFDEVLQEDGQELSLRGEDAIESLFETIALRYKNGTSCQLFSGYTGTGKTTELARLAKLLREEGYIVLYADARDYHDLSHKLLIEELLIMLAGAFGEQAAKWHDPDADPTKNKNSYWNRVVKFIGKQVSVENIQIKAGPLNFKTSLKHGRGLDAQIKEYLAGSLPELVTHVHDYVRETVEAVRKKEKKSRGVVFLFDNLERIKGTESEMRATMNSVAKVFSQYAEFLRLPHCHTVYTVPPYLQVLLQALDNNYDSSRLAFMPAVKVFQKQEGLSSNAQTIAPWPLPPYEPGIQALEQLIAKRIDVDQVFGAERAHTLHKLILASGGHLKTLLRLIQELLTRYSSLMRRQKAPFPVTGQEVERIIQKESERIRNQIRPEGVPLLESIRQTASTSRIKDQDIELFARYQDTQIVLCYRNGEGWFELHPLIHRYIAEQAQQLTAKPDQA